MAESTEYKVPYEVLQALEDQLTDDLVTRLIAYAEDKQRRLYWQNIRGWIMPNGLEAEDLVTQTVEKILDGRRKWQPSKDPDLFEYMKFSVIRSDINHAAKSQANRQVRCESGLIEKQKNGETASYFDTLVSNEKDPENALLAKQQAEASDRFLWDLLEDLEDAPLLQGMVESIIDGVTKPAKMAEALSVKTKEINNAKKRLKKRIEKFRASREDLKPDIQREESLR